MANLKEIRDRISSVKNTRKITEAMRLVAAAKVRRAQEQVLRSRPFADRLRLTMLNQKSQLNIPPGRSPSSLKTSRTGLRSWAGSGSRGNCSSFSFEEVTSLDP